MGTKRGSYSGVIGPNNFPGQTLGGNLKTPDLNVLFGIYQDTSQSKGKSFEYESNPDLRDFENVPGKVTKLNLEDLQ